MTVVDAAFWVFGVTAVVSGYRVFCTDSMVRASFLLLLSFIAVALIMLLLAAPYLGVATLFMMGVEMMVMALFMVMFMMNPAGLNPMRMVHQHRFSIIAGAVAFAGLAIAVLYADFPRNPVAADRAVIVDLGKELLGKSMLIFESAGVTLLATMVGSVILSSRSGRFGAADEGSVPPPLEPGGVPAGRVPSENGGEHHHQDHGADPQDGSVEEADAATSSDAGAEHAEQHT